MNTENEDSRNRAATILPLAEPTEEPPAPPLSNEHVLLAVAMQSVNRVDFGTAVPLEFVVGTLAKDALRFKVKFRKGNTGTFPTDSKDLEAFIQYADDYAEHGDNVYNSPYPVDAGKVKWWKTEAEPGSLPRVRRFEFVIKDSTPDVDYVVLVRRWTGSVWEPCDIDGVRVAVRVSI